MTSADVSGSDHIVDDGGKVVLYVDRVVQCEQEYVWDGKFSDGAGTELGPIHDFIWESILKDSSRFHRIAENRLGVSEHTTTGVHVVVDSAKDGALRVPYIHQFELLCHEQ